MNIFLFSTTDFQANRQEELSRMLGSISAVQRDLPHAVIELHLLFQRCPEAEFESLKDTLPTFVRPQAIPNLVSLSKARNLLLAPTLKRIPNDALVAFPDDDGWYPDGLVPQLTERFAADPGLGFLFCRYGSQPRMWSDQPAPEVRLASARDVVRNASSNTLFVTGATAHQVGLFDEALGLGTPNQGAEDLDYALRAFLSSERSTYMDAVLVGHRDKNPQIRAKYYRGGLITLARYAGRRGAIGAEYVRKVGVGAYLCLRRELGFGAYLSALAAGPRSA
jgi:hypothetical protein